MIYQGWWVNCGQDWLETDICIQGGLEAYVEEKANYYMPQNQFIEYNEQQ